MLSARSNPGVARVLVRLLHTRGRQEADVLLKGLAPGALRSEAETPAGVASYNDTTGGLRGASVITGEDRLELTAGFSDVLARAIEHADGDLDTGVRAALCRWLLDEERTGRDPHGTNEDMPSADLARAASWVLDVDPSGPWLSNTDDARSLPRRLEEDTDRQLPGTAFTGTNSWPVAVRWLTFLGLAREPRRGELTPDASVAIGWFLPELLPTTRVGIQEFLAALAERLPVFGGHLERAWHAASGVPHASTVAPSLAHSLMVLADKRSRRISLYEGTDASSAVMLTFGTWDPIETQHGTVSPASMRVAAIDRPEEEG